MTTMKTNGLDGAARAVPYTGTGEARPGDNAQVGVKPSIPIAIVGMACRFSGDVSNPNQLWELCVSGRDGWTPVPKDRFDVKGLYHEDPTRVGKSHIRGGYFMKDDLSLFDAAFFNVSSDVASCMDPQARLLLEIVYEATEDAGIPIEKLAGTNTSVFAGVFTTDYREMQTKDSEVLPYSSFAALGSALTANRVSHFFDLQGPSMAIDTGSSGGLVAVHQGCQSIRSGESNISIVGAASAMLSQEPFIAGSKFGAMNEEGKCFGWDERASGFGRGEGVAALILQPLDAALQTGNRVHAVIRDSGLNQDGKTTTIVSPSVDAQAKLIRDCYERAGLDLASTGYIEAHMTGTTTGDPVEAEAIARTFGASRDAGDPVMVGSAKTNIGHTENVSGLAALIKATLALKHRIIPPNLNYERTNPQIPLEVWHVQVPTAPTPWPRNKLLRASVNNFGYGGTNAHVILDGAAADTYTGTETDRNGTSDGNDDFHGDSCQSYVYLLSAKSSSACDTMMRLFAAHIQDAATPPPRPSDLAFTLAERRSRHSWVTAVRARSIAQLGQRLSGATLKPSSAAKTPRLGFVFNGQGAQWHAMGRELVQAYPVFARSLQQADGILREYGAPWSLTEELMRDESTTRLAEIQLSQAVNVAVQLCLVDLVESWDIIPTAVTSHSSGEIAAAYALKAVSFRQALGLAHYRGELISKYQKLRSLRGGMLAAAVSSGLAEQYAAESGGHVVVACINGPSSVTLSGDLDALEEVAARLEKDGIFVRKLKVPVAYHSHHMRHIEKEYMERLSCVLPASPNKHWNHEAIFVSPVTGNKVESPADLSADHWARNLTGPVLFSQAFGNMMNDVDLAVEIGAHSTLAAPIRQILEDRGVEMPYVSCLKRPLDAVDTMQDLACHLLSHGYPVDLREVNWTSKAPACKLVTGLPTYPWEHNQRYWVEPRVSQEQRFKKFPPHELLGSPLNGSNGLLPTWRNFLRLTEVPWLEDHRVDGVVMFPGAGYMVSAIEAVRLLTDPSEATIRGYKLRDIDIISSMVIPDSASGIETQLTLRPCSDKKLDHDGWWQFELSSLADGGSWTRHCEGFVAAECVDTSTKSDLTCEEKAPQESQYLSHSDDMAVVDVDIETFYSNLRVNGVHFGARFQNIVRRRVAGKRAMTNFAIAGFACEEHDYVLHPTTLDSIMQSCAGGAPEDKEENGMMLPRSIQALSVPRTFKRRGGDGLQSFSELVEADAKGCTFSAAVVAAKEDGESAPCALRVRGLFFQPVPRQTDSTSEEVCLYAKSRWELDVLHKLPSNIKTSLAISASELEEKYERRLVEGAFYCIHDAFMELEGQSQDTWGRHHRRMFAWMKWTVERGRQGALGPGSQVWHRASNKSRAMLLDELDAGDVAGRLMHRVGRNLAGILRGDVNPIELMTEDGLLTQFYNNFNRLKARSYKNLLAIVELYALKSKPGASVLEIGAGTGGATTAVLQGFRSRLDEHASLLGRYTFTDKSPALFDAAKPGLAEWASLMEYKTLDIEIDPLQQGFTAGAYDLVVASLTLHAATNLDQTMARVRKLLKPGGSLLMIEGTTDCLPWQLVFGTMPGWWMRAEPERQTSPCASLDMWNRVLRRVGFTGVDLEVPDYEEQEFKYLHVMASRTSTALQGTFSIVLPPGEEANHVPAERRAWLSRLAEAVGARTGVAPRIVSLDDADSWQQTVCIFIAEMEQSLVDGMDAETFGKVQKLLLNNAGLLWISCGGIVDASEPSFGAADGLIRTMRREDGSQRWVKLDFDRDGNPWALEKIGHIVHVLQQSFDQSVETCDVECEYAVRGSVLHVNRWYPDKAQDVLVGDLGADPVPELQLFHQPGRSLVWEVSNPGTMGLDPYFVDNQQVITTEVPSVMVEIEAKAFGLNFKEVMIQLGRLDKKLQTYECSGIVTALGSDTQESGLSVGDRVCALIRGGMASRGRARWTSVVKVPDASNMSWEGAASFPVAYATAYGCLIQTARLRRGETVLVHAAVGATGQAAVVLAQYVGAEVFATCSTRTKRHLLMEQYGIPEDHIFSSRDASFHTAVMAKTDGKGVDVVLNSLSGPLLKSSWDCVARFGRFVDITKVDVQANRRLETAPFERCAVFTSFDLMQISEHRGRQLREALVESLRVIQGRRTTPISPITSFPMSDMAAAMRKMQQGSHMGKLVLVPRPGDTVKVVSRLPPLALDRDDATYMVSGGLGSIGRALVSWLIARGAKNVLLVSRHASLHAAAPTLLDEANTAGCRLVIRDCDVSDENKLLNLLRECSEAGLPPIRGAINGAMVLNDSVMERMAFDEWANAVRPKIDGSRNLHKHLPAMEFFVMLSSVVGVAGHVSQANYAAGCSYQDALARHRTARGLPAMAIDIGAMTTIGMIAEQEAGGDTSLRTKLQKAGFEAVNPPALLRVVEAAIRDPLKRPLADSQIAVGLSHSHARTSGTAVGQERRFGALLAATQRSAPSAGNSSTSAAALVAGLEGASSLADATKLLVDALGAKLADIFSKPLSYLDPGMPLSRYGVDSLVAVELRSWISRTIKAKVSVFELTQGVSLQGLAALLATRSPSIISKSSADTQDSPQRQEG